jgi:hypothetical protein
MNLSQELKNGFLICIGLGLYFLFMEALDLSNLFVLRFLNVFIIIYGLNKTIRYNLKKNKKGFVDNLISSGLTGIIGVFLGIVGLILYINFKGGTQYLNHLSEAFLFGGNPSIAEYAFALFIEGIASVIVVTFVNIQYWKMKDVFKDEV